MKLKKLTNRPPVSSTQSPAFGRRHFGNSVLLRSLALGVACGLFVTVRASATNSGDDFMINVRTSVEREYTLFSKKPAVTHSKLYALAWIKQAAGNSGVDVGNADPLVSPVDETALLQEFHDVLAARGFHEPESGKVPDVLFTVLYGRSKLKNPYDDHMIASAGGELGTDGGGGSPMAGGSSYGYASMSGSSTVTGGADMMMTERTPGADKEKRMAANGEKVFISITAWEYPGFVPKPKPKLLWRTTINVDDPTLNLNMIAEKMLAVAAPYFDREIKEKELSLSSSLADATPAKNSPMDSGSNKSIR